VKDVEHAIAEAGKQCRALLDVKGIEWPESVQDLLRDAREAKSLQDHYEILVRLTARLRDGHARVVVHDEAKGVRWPGPAMEGASGPGLFLCRSDGKILVKQAWDAAARAGVSPGMEVLVIEGKPAAEWIEETMREHREWSGFSTEQQAFYFACHWGLGGKSGSKLALRVRSLDGKERRVEVRRAGASFVPDGPVFPPENLKSLGRQRYGRTAAGNGYIHLRDCPGDLPEQMDRMLEEIGDVPGLVLDFRANGGGGFDHDGLLARFVESGPIAVIVDAGVRSAGETASGMFKEDRGAPMIGESPTAGMSSSKTTIDLPSGLFSLYVSVRSNKGRFNRGRGIEGIGVLPDEIVEYDPADLANGVDTLLGRAEERLR